MLDKKDIEEKCLRIASDAAKHQSGKSRLILEMLNGEEFDREDTERPDFVKIYRFRDKRKTPIMLGVEHFRVDQISIQKKDGKVASVGVGTEKELWTLYEEQCNKVEEGTFDAEDATLGIGQIISKHVAKKSNTTYNTFIESFRYSLDKHLPSVPVYLKNLKRYSQGKYDTKLALLIEIHTELYGLFFHDKKGMRRKKNGLVPIVEDMVKLLEEKIDKRSIDYIILCIGETLYTKDVNVVAFSTNQIRSQILSQHLPIYQYIGDDILIDAFNLPSKITKIEPEVTKNDSGIRIVFHETRTDVSEKRKQDYTFYSLKKAFDYERLGIPYVTNVSVQFSKYLLSDYIMGWDHPKGEEKWIIRPLLKRIDHEEFEKKSEAFEEEWFKKFKELGND